MMRKITILLAGALIVGGVFVKLKKDEPMTYEDYQVLIAIYNHEIEIRNGVFQLAGVEGETPLDKINTIITTEEVPGDVILEGETIPKQDYENAKKALIKKSKIKKIKD